MDIIQRGWLILLLSQDLLSLQQLRIKTFHSTFSLSSCVLVVLKAEERHDRVVLVLFLLAAAVVLTAAAAAAMLSAVHLVGLRRDEHEHERAVPLLELPLVLLHGVVVVVALLLLVLAAVAAGLGGLGGAGGLGAAGEVGQAALGEVEGGEGGREGAVLVEVLPPNAGPGIGDSQ